MIPAPSLCPVGWRWFRNPLRGRWELQRGQVTLAFVSDEQLAPSADYAPGMPWTPESAARDDINEHVALVVAPAFGVHPPCCCICNGAHDPDGICVECSWCRDGCAASVGELCGIFDADTGGRPPRSEPIPGAYMCPCGDRFDTPADQIVHSAHCAKAREGLGGATSARAPDDDVEDLGGV